MTWALIFAIYRRSLLIPSRIRLAGEREARGQGTAALFKDPTGSSVVHCGIAFHAALPRTMNEKRERIGLQSEEEEKKDLRNEKARPVFVRRWPGWSCVRRFQFYNFLSNFTALQIIDIVTLGMSFCGQGGLGYHCIRYFNFCTFFIDISKYIE